MNVYKNNQITSTNVSIKWLTQNLYYVYLKSEYSIKKLIQLIHVNHEILLL